MTLFKTWKRQKLVLGEEEPSYRVKYLGNVQTGFMRGDGCVDKPTAVLWNNYAKNGQSVGLDMTITICPSGMRALTREQGLTEYRAHRISYCVAHPGYPRLFVWVYRHEGKKMKVELRCHAVLCKSEAKAKLMAVQLHEKLSFALAEFLREKTRRQNSRLALQKANALSCGAASAISGAALRNKFLSTAQNFKPSVQNSAGAPKLGAISEHGEEEAAAEEEERERIGGHREEASDDGEDAEDDEEGQSAEDDSCGEDGDVRPGPVLMNTHPSMASLRQADQPGSDLSSGERTVDDLDLESNVYDLVIGNDIEQLKLELQTSADDSDGESSESGFSEQDCGSGRDGGAERRAGSGTPIGHRIQNGHGSGSERNVSNNNNLIVDYCVNDKDGLRPPVMTELNIDDVVTAL